MRMGVVAVKNLALRFWNCEAGATAIEYGLIGAFIFLAIISATAQTGTQLGSVFTKIKDNLG